MSLPETVEIVDMKLIDVWVCAFCQGGFEADGPDGLLPHFAQAHPEYLQLLIDR